MKLKLLAKGLATFMPGMNGFLDRGTGGTDSARYCYTVWLRHIVMAERNGLDSHPNVVAELGPGDSLGIGLAAMVSGCDAYLALDVVQHATTERNLQVCDDLVKLFRARTPLPGDDEFPQVKPRLECYDFPSHIYDDSRMQDALDDSRIERITSAVRNPNRSDSPIRYEVPWHSAGVIERESVDMIYSQAVLEHVVDLGGTYGAMYAWLKPGGYMSHQIDFKCHGTADEWNGHWAYSDLAWRLVKGRRPYLLNRQPHSVHIAMMGEHGFEVVCDKTIRSESGLARRDLASRFRSLSADDLVTSGAFIQSVKRNPPSAER